MIPPSLPTRYQPCFEVRGYEGSDALLAFLLPKSLFARHVAKKLTVALGGCRGFVLPDGSVWGIEEGGRVTRIV